MSVADLRKYVTSFSDGRVRIRHPALRKTEISNTVKTRFSVIPGVLSVECSTLTGSMLILFDPSRFSNDDLIAHGTRWGKYLDEVEAGHDPAVPE